MIKIFIICICLFSSNSLSAQIPQVSDSTNKIDEFNKRQGYWVNEYIYNNEKTIEVGYYNDDMKEGIWQTYSAEGSLKEEMEYRNNVLEGLKRTYRKNGMLHGEGQNKDGKVDGLFIGYDTLGIKMSEQIWDHGILIDSKYQNPNAKPTGTIEEIDGKQLIWVNGELLPFKIINVE